MHAIGDTGNVFKGDVCKFAGPPQGSCTGVDYTPGLCCGMASNGGLWLLHPTPNGVRLMETWLAVSITLHGSRLSWLTCWCMPLSCRDS